MSFIRDFVYRCCQAKFDDGIANVSNCSKAGTSTNRSIMDATSLTVPDRTPVKTQPSPISWQLDLSTIMSESFEILDDYRHCCTPPRRNNVCLFFLFFKHFF